AIQRPAAVASVFGVRPRSQKGKCSLKFSVKWSGQVQRSQARLTCIALSRCKTGGGLMSIGRRIIGLFTREQGQAGEASYQRGETTLRSGDLTAAQSEFEEVVACGLLPDHLREAHSYLGQVHLAGGHLDDAIAAYRKAVALDPQ